MIIDILIQLLSGVSRGMVLFVVASGLTLIFGVLRIPNFCHGSLYMLAAFVTYSITTAFGSSNAGFLASLIACDPQTELAPAVKPIFEQKKEKEIIGNLSLFIKSRESDIEKLCHQNFAVCPLTHTDSYY